MWVFGGDGYSSAMAIVKAVEERGLKIFLMLKRPSLFKSKSIVRLFEAGTGY